MISTLKISGGAPSRNRTDTPLRERDFESRASTNSATGATGGLRRHNTHRAPLVNIYSPYFSKILNVVIAQRFVDCYDHSH